METFDKVMVLGLVISCCALSSIITYGAVMDEIGESYHCAPIVKVSTMEEAKKQIEINQAITGAKG
tara:strand:+ start:1114 stop:1311 length:198 start_codon:yes stop_codon:yes gene_type:complete